ncbi:LLM class F420-dependent oxidoreductase [Actinomadura darangshiensis]|uniref:LLM class F420-dependent oxidoreductase n=1 Tax=Actinomadura darangshiensis TaxID=705336 RepID=A0A4R5BDH1_9ACTN|nr:LLM class F420-dependent oxidoreductase [Actinomadura darangshiensis]TDD81622.1 LLM class F420-dependent oxidoreductase [Actinomadura darangshiensis]
MRLRIFTEPQQGASYETQLAVAKAAEDLGFDAYFRSDHYVKMGDVTGEPGPSDSWVTLGALARETSRIRLGTLVTAATFRYPGPLAISVAQVDQMSGGRVDLGLGTGWFEQEHTAYGIPFPSLGERFERLEEQLEILTGLWGTPDGDTYSFSGKHYALADSPALPKPAQAGGPPIIIGGIGAKRTPRLAARYADEYNVPFHQVEDTGAAFDRVRAACAEAGRTRPVVYSAAQVVCCGRDEAELERRAGAIGRQVSELRGNGLAGTPAELVDKIGRFGELGAECVYLQVLDLHDLEHLELLASEVLSKV